MSDPTLRRKKPKIAEVDTTDTTEKVKEAPTPKPEPKTARFHVRRLDDRIIINSNLPLADYPTTMAVIDQLNSPHAKDAKVYYHRYDAYGTIESIIANFWGIISPEDWANAMCAAVLLTQKTSNEAVAEMVRPVADAFLTIDNTLYKLMPCAIVKTNRALATVRKRAIEVAKTSADSIIAKANDDATTRIYKANADAKIIYDKANKIMEAAQAAKAEVDALPPQWALSAGYPIFRSSSPITHWRVLLTCSMKVQKFVYEALTETGNKRREWTALPRPTAIVFTYSAALDIYFSISNLMTYDGSAWPHITREKSCMQPADAPKSLKSAADITRLVNCVDRTLSVVDLHSMLAGPGSIGGGAWSSRMWSFVPPDLEKLLKNRTPTSALVSSLNPPPPKPAEPKAIEPDGTPVRPTELALPPAPAITNIDRNEERRETWTA